MACLLLTVSRVDAQSRQRSRRRVDTTTTATTPPIKTSWAIHPDTVTVGDLFTLRVTVEVPADAVVNWPTISDSAAVVSVRAPAKVTSALEGAVRHETAEYSMAAWDVGRANWRTFRNSTFNACWLAV